MVAKKWSEWTAYVKAVVPPEQLLLIDIDQKGALDWAPICEFLGKDVPKAPFPNVNDTKEFQERSKSFKYFVLFAPLVGTLGVCGAIAGAAYYWNKTFNN